MSDSTPNPIADQPVKILADGSEVPATDPRIDHVAVLFPDGWMVACRPLTDEDGESLPNADAVDAAAAAPAPAAGEAASLPSIVREVLEWYASDPSLCVAWNEEGWSAEKAAKASGHYTFVGEDRYGHSEYVPNSVRAEEALAALDEWLAQDRASHGAAAGVPEGIVGEMRNFADVADQCQLTEGNACVVIRAWADRLAAAKLASQTAPVVPEEPDQALLVSMATCLNHGFGLLDPSRQASMLHDMRKLWAEVTGRGYYTPENRDRYAAMLAAAPQPPAPDAQEVR
ncbi:hypothetical protein ABE488_09030 [Luteimonas sp. TWI662]|uniref:hypothetical protein n=1 Tax=Luteimonas sp. TWI662 TaxID=3136789 RepID=UPI0032097F31